MDKKNVNSVLAWKGGSIPVRGRLKSSYVLKEQNSEENRWGPAMSSRLALDTQDTARQRRIPKDGK